MIYKELIVCCHNYRLLFSGFYFLHLIQLTHITQLINDTAIIVQLSNKLYIGLHSCYLLNYLNSVKIPALKFKTIKLI